MKKAVISLGLMVALSPVASVFAQDDANVYVGGRFGVSTIDGVCEGGGCGSDNDVGGGIILGYDFGNSFSIESTYDYLGNFDSNYTGVGPSSGDLTALTLAPKFNVGVSDATDLYGKLGVAMWDWNSSAGDQDDYTILAALGIDHRATDLVNLRLEWQYLPDMDKGYYDADNHLISAGVTFHFGRTSPAPEPEPVMVVEEVVEEVVETKKYVFSEADDVELFAFGKSTLSNQATQQLNPMLKRLQDFEESTAIIIGHTDSVGSEAFNQTLSEERAQTVANYFTDNGISADRLSVVGMGEGEPVASNDTEEGRAKNRRVEIESPEFVYEE